MVQKPGVRLCPSLFTVATPSTAGSTSSSYQPPRRDFSRIATARLGSPAPRTRRNIRGRRSAFGIGWRQKPSCDHSTPRPRIRRFTDRSSTIAPTKTLAKVANETAKKKAGYNGVCILDTPARWEPLLAAFDVGDVWGISPQYKKLLNQHGVTTALEFSRLPEAFLRRHMSVVGARTAAELNGQPCLELELHADLKKGITVSRSFGKRITEFPELSQALGPTSRGSGEAAPRKPCSQAHARVRAYQPFCEGRGKGPILRSAFVLTPCRCIRTTRRNSPITRSGPWRRCTGRAIAT